MHLFFTSLRLHFLSSCKILVICIFALTSCAANNPKTAQTHIQTPQERFTTWLKGVEKDARVQGISNHTLKATLPNIVLNERIIALDRKQPENAKSFERYFTDVISTKRLQQAKSYYREHYGLLNSLGNQYGVEPSIIIALWGVESNFGQLTGNFSTINSLATLAYDGRRSEFFRQELLNALAIIDQGHITPENMKGSWAGAMGQTQFMPSSYLKYAVDYDKDGLADIWNTRIDVFASIAHYLGTVGWDRSMSWGEKVIIPANIDPSLISSKIDKPLAEWHALGVKRANGNPLPEKETMASLIIPGKDKGSNTPFLVYKNYKTLLDWNRSLYFATSVGLFSDLIKNKE